MTDDAAAIRAYTSGVLRARRAYHHDDLLTAQEAKRRRRKAAAQQRYRDRLKEQQK